MTSFEKSPLTHDRIAVRAYERFAARGYQNGHDLDDWLWAEATLRAEAQKAAAGCESKPPSPHHHHAPDKSSMHRGSTSAPLKSQSKPKSKKR